MATTIDANGRQTDPSAGAAQSQRHNEQAHETQANQDRKEPSNSQESPKPSEIRSDSVDTFDEHEQHQDNSIKDLQGQNEKLRKQVEDQQKEIDELKQQLQAAQASGPQAQNQDAQKAEQTNPQAPQNGQQPPQNAPQNGPQTSQETQQPNGTQQPQSDQQTPQGQQSEQQQTQGQQPAPQQAQGQQPTTPNGQQTAPNATQQALDVQEQNHPGSTEQNGSGIDGKNDGQAENEVNFADMKNLAAKLTTTSGSEREQVLAQLLSAIVASMQALYNKVSGISKPQAQNQQQTDLNTQAQQQTQEQAQNGTVNPSNPQQQAPSTQAQGTTSTTTHQATASAESGTTSQSQSEQQSQLSPAQVNKELREKHPDDYKEILGAARSMAFAKENGLQLDMPSKEQMIKNGMSPEEAQKKQDIYDAAKGYCADMEKATAAMPEDQRQTPYEAIAQEHDASRHAVTAKSMTDKNPMLGLTSQVTSMTPGAQAVLNKNIESQKIAREFSIASENGMGMSMTGESKISAEAFDRAADIYNNTKPTNNQTKTTALDANIALNEIAAGKLTPEKGADKSQTFNDKAFEQGTQDMNKQLDNSATVDPSKLQPEQPTTQKAAQMDQTYSA